MISIDSCIVSDDLILAILDKLASIPLFDLGVPQSWVEELIGLVGSQALQDVE